MIARPTAEIYPLLLAGRLVGGVHQQARHRVYRVAVYDRATCWWALGEDAQAAGAQDFGFIRLSSRLAS